LAWPALALSVILIAISTAITPTSIAIVIGLPARGGRPVIAIIGGGGLRAAGASRLLIVVISIVAVGRKTWALAVVGALVAATTRGVG
jgi:hypothetical protein